MGEGQLNKQEREKVSRAALVDILVCEISVAMGGRDANHLKPRIKIIPLHGEPNWGASIGEVPLNTLSAYNEAIGRVRARYDLDEHTT
jgi:hypothetical protein